MRSPTVAYAIVVALLMAVLVVPSASAIGDTGQNEIRVAISGWWFGGETPVESMDVSFKISFDTDSDGTYEQVNESAIIYDQSFLAGPFQASYYAEDSVQSVISRFLQ